MFFFDARFHENMTMSSLACIVLLAALALPVPRAVWLLLALAVLSYAAFVALPVPAAPAAEWMHGRVRGIRATQTRRIPKIVFQTYDRLEFVPAKVHANVAEFAAGYKHVVLDDEACRQFLARHYAPEIVARFASIRGGAHKADLLRYCLLYVHGGVYLDIKTELTRPIDALFDDDRASLYVVRDIAVFWRIGGRAVYNGVIASVPRDPLFLRLIAGIMRMSDWLLAVDYSRVVREFGATLADEVGALVPGGTTRPGGSRVYAFEARCVDVDTCRDGPDRYGLCVHIFDGDEPVIKVRHADFLRWRHVAP